MVTLVVGLATNDLHEYLKRQFGDGYTMQFAVLALGHPAVPYVVAFAAIVGLWWWSQGAPPEQLVTVVEYRDPEPTEAQRRVAAAAAARTTWKGAIWKWQQGSAIPCCPEVRHEEQQLLFVDRAGEVHDDFPRNSLARPKCVFDEEHTVELDDGIGLDGWLRAAEYEGIALEARGRLRG